MGVVFVVRLKGGPGSGHHGHAGRPGKHGGSLPSGVAMSIRTGRAAAIRAGWKPSAPKPKEPIVISQPQPTRAVDTKWYESWVETVEDPEGAYIADTKASDFLSGDLPSWEGVYGDKAVAVKKEVMTSVMGHANDVLAERGLDPVSAGAVAGAVSWWADSSNDSRRALSMQASAAEEFGFKLSKWQKDRIKANRYSIVSNATDRAILRGMYNNTQEELRKAGYKPGDTVKLFRGLAYGEDPGLAGKASAAYKGNVLGSWSLSMQIAGTFTQKDNYGAMLAIDVPISSIMSTARTGFGCMQEGEFVVFGNVPKSKVNILWAEEW